MELPELEARRAAARQAGFSEEKIRAYEAAQAGGQMEEGEPEARPMGERLTRQVGLTARSAGPVAVGASLGAAMGAPLGGVGAVPGAMAGAGAMAIVQMIDKLGGTNYIEQAMDALGLPKPEGSSEKLVAGATDAMAGMAGLTGVASTIGKTAGPIGKEISRTLTQNPGMGQVSAASGGAASEGVRQAGGDEASQILASIAASAAAPVGMAVGSKVAGGVGRALKDTGAAIGAAFGNKASTTKLATDVVGELVKDNPESIKQALLGARTFVPGAKPTVGEALAEYNMKQPTQQVGGAVIKLQDSLTGAKGIEDVLPSVLKGNEAAVAAHRERVQGAAGRLRSMAMESATRAGRTNILPLKTDIALLTGHPEFRGNPAAIRALQTVARESSKLANPKTGAIPPEDLYTLRQNLGAMIDKAYTDTGNMQKTGAAKLGRELQKSIDLAMEQGGAVGWKEYLRVFNKGMGRAEAHEERLAEMGKIGKGIAATSPESVVKEELPNIPTLLHRPTMFANFILRLIAKDATTPVAREIATRMGDPKAFAELLRRPPAAPASKAVNDILINASVLSSLIKKHQADNAPTAEESTE